MNTGMIPEQFISALRRNRPAAIVLLAKYGVTRLQDLRLRDLESFTQECEALAASAPLPPVELVPAFAIGERVKHRTGLGSVGLKVTGYQLRYTLEDCYGAPMWRGAGVLAEKLERVEAPPVPPAPSVPPPPMTSPAGYVYLSQVSFGHIVERYTNKVEYFVSSSYDGTGNRKLTTLHGIPKEDISQAELVRDLGPVRVITSPPPPVAPAPVSDWDIGRALYNAVTKVEAAKLGQSFSKNADALRAELAARGLKVVRE